MFRKTILLALALVVTVSSAALAQDRKFSPTQTEYLKKVKACLIENKIDITSERPECYISTEFRVRCLTPALGAIGSDCNKKALPGAGDRL